MKGTITFLVHMKYDYYSVLDFVRDEEFQSWVKEPDERSNFYWQSWMQNHKEKIYLVNEAREIITSVNFSAKNASPEIVREVFENILQNERPVSLQKVEIQHSKRIFLLRKKIIVAASFLLLMASGFVLFNLNQPVDEIQQEALNELIIKENQPGQKSTFQLSDGSIIKLNASSKLIVPDSFGIKRRDVFLEGEAFFKIAKNPHKPFMVHAGDISTLVTGTAFNVRAYNENNIRVAVFEGRVNAILCNEGKSDTLTLSKSDMAEYDKVINTLSKTTYNYLEVMGWKDGVIYFENVSSKEAFEYLERWYGMNIHVINENKIPGAFHGEFKNEILENVLIAMGKALQFDFELHEKNVIIKPNKND